MWRKVIDQENRLYSCLTSVLHSRQSIAFRSVKQVAWRVNCANGWMSIYFILLTGWVDCTERIYDALSERRLYALTNAGASTIQRSVLQRSHQHVFIISVSSCVVKQSLVFKVWGSANTPPHQSNYYLEWRGLSTPLLQS